eukprot:3057067-Rhodomonas_salina.13
MIRGMVSGPDTRGKETLLSSDKEWAPPPVPMSKWNVKVYESPTAIDAVPAKKDLETLRCPRDAEGIVPFLDIDNNADLKKVTYSPPA